MAKTRSARSVSERKLRQDVGDDLRFDPILRQIPADQLVAGAAIDERPGTGLREARVREQPGLGEAVEGLLSLAGRNPGPLQPAIEITAGAVPMPERAERELRRVAHFVATSTSASAGAADSACAASATGRSRAETICSGPSSVWS